MGIDRRRPVPENIGRRFVVQTLDSERRANYEAQTQSIWFEAGYQNPTIDSDGALQRTANVTLAPRC